EPDLDPAPLVPCFDHPWTAKPRDGSEVPAKQPIMAAAGSKGQILTSRAIVNHNGFRPGVSILVQHELRPASPRYRAPFAQPCRDHFAAVGQHVADTQDV